MHWQTAAVSRPLMLLDAASLYFRAFYGVPESITAPDGTPVNAVRGFCDMVSRLLTDRRPGRLDRRVEAAFSVEARGSLAEVAVRLGLRTGVLTRDDLGGGVGGQ